MNLGTGAVPKRMGRRAARIWGLVFMLHGATAQSCTTTNHYDVQQGDGACAALLQGSHTCAESFVGGSNSIAGACNLQCEVNNYDAQYGAGSCNFMIAVGIFDCAAGTANGVACEVIPAALDDGTQPPAEGCCDFACGACAAADTTCDALPPATGSATTGTAPGVTAPVDYIDLSGASAPGACSTALASGMETCAAIASGTSTVLLPGNGYCNLACQFNMLEAPLEYVPQSMLDVLIGGLGATGASWLGITTATTNVYDDAAGAGQCDALVAAGYTCNGYFSLGGVMGFMGSSGNGSLPPTGLTSTPGLCDITCADDWNATTGASHADVQAAMVQATTGDTPTPRLCEKAILASAGSIAFNGSALDFLPAGWICDTDLMGPSFMTVLAGEDEDGYSYVPRMAGLGFCDFACGNVQVAPPGECR